jgi:uncharacterized integral membrane protein
MFRNTLFAILIVLVIIFVVQNTQVVEVKFLAWQVNMSRALMLFGTLAIGLVAGWLIKVPKRKKDKLR